jgi:hypothetical protein
MAVRPKTSDTRDKNATGLLINNLAIFDAQRLKAGCTSANAAFEVEGHRISVDWAGCGTGYDEATRYVEVWTGGRRGCGDGRHRACGG